MVPRGAATTDSDIVTTLLVQQMTATGGLEEAAHARCCRSCSGAFCFVMMDERSVFAARDPFGVGPCRSGGSRTGSCVASETCALDIVGAAFVRDVEPGELIRFDDRGLHSVRFAESPRTALCVFEYVYLARPDSRIARHDRARGPPRDGPHPGA